ncbi:hypothetical protein [Halogeometricum luteum]|uniref:Histidine kinase n=1 Tax=Halogeometricum luteum TaxID=2950537 RepID=A0ABU2G706_9EURY|nr:hypothetical protein [Halogeometricum sp. S3BR5-2]MDS0296580.1 hypothetical protein [Halogeometricum sp. S3BR5-2]
MSSTTKPTDFDRGYAQVLATRLRRIPTLAWVAAAVGGFIGSVPLGLMMQYGNPEPLIALALPMMYGFSGPDLLAGWAIHQFHGVALAVMYVAAAQWQPVTGHAKTLRGAVALAVVVGVVSTALFSVLLMPLWLGAIGYPFTPTVPDLAMPEKLWSVFGHVIYALPATLGYALVTRR